MDKVNKDTPYGSLKISKEAISKLIGDEVISVYGVAGVVSSKVKDNNMIINDGNFSKGIIVSKDNKGSYNVDIHVSIIYPLKVTEIINEVQKRVKYTIAKQLGITFKYINIYVDGLLIDKVSK